MTASRFVYRLELVVDFDRPVSYAKGRDTARRIMDSLNLYASGCEAPEGFGEAALKCSELRRLLKISLDPAPDNDDVA